MADFSQAEAIIGKKYDDMHPFVRNLLAKTAPGGELNMQWLEAVNRVHRSLGGPPYIIIKDRGYKEVRVKRAQLDPTPEDITENFIHIARGIEHICDHYGDSDTAIRSIEVVSPEKMHNRNMALQTEINDGIVTDMKLFINDYFLYCCKAHRIARTRNPLVLDEKIPSRGTRLGFFARNAYLTAYAIEEADHAHWQSHPKEFEATFGEPLKKSPKGLAQHEYEDDKLEGSATKRIAASIKPLKLDVFQLS